MTKLEQLGGGNVDSSLVKKMINRNMRAARNAEHDKTLADANFRLRAAYGASIQDKYLHDESSKGDIHSRQEYDSDKDVYNPFFPEGENAFFHVAIPQDIEYAQREQKENFETSKVDTADTYRLPTIRSTIGNVFHPGGLPGAGKAAIITSLIEDLADANMTGKGAVLLCNKANATKSNMFSSCIDQSTPGKDGGYKPESKFVTINSGFAIPVIKNSAETEDGMIQSYINNLSPLEATKEEDSSSMDGLDLFDDSNFEELKMLDVHERPLTTFARLYIVARISEGVEDKRAERVFDAIMNALFRSGDEPKGFVPLAEVFKFNIKELMEKLSREDLTTQNLIELANRAARGELASEQREQKQRRAVEYDSEDEKEGYYDDYGEEEEEIISRRDKPKEIDINNRTHKRV
ncbi:hypothetical protein O3P69_015532 [Scylla paramamosain]|uniref:Uncharacterized protein n=1 Tax=Scylla paramamosain TaxID=85552 RepID=A0AAW0SFK4_SCYPA